ncbi:MAG: GGDEF domain-containing protein [Ruminiclostridium sp.]|nr:GGDEF domain-containing protein [Ruminiclostridium sp.]
MKKDNDKFELIALVGIIAVALFALSASLISILSLENPQNKNDTAVVEDYSAGWKNTGGIVNNINGMLNVSNSLSQTEPLRLTKTIKSVKNGDMLYIHARNLVINVYFEGRPLYITAENGNSNTLPGFDGYIFVSLPETDSQSTLELDIFTTDYSDKYGIGSIVVGPEKTIVQKLLGENIIPVILGVIFLVVGTGLIIFGFLTRKKVDSYLSSVYYGIFLVLVSLGMIFDTSWAHIVTDKISFVEASQRIFLSAALPAFIAFIDAFFVTEHVWPVKVIKFVSIAVFSVMIVTNSIGIATFVGAGTYFLIFESFCGVVVFEELLVFMLKTRGTKALRKQWDYISVFIYIACCLFDILVFLNMSVGNDDLFFTRIGLIIMSSVTMVSWFGEILGMVKLGVQAGKIGKIAFTDANTGIGNVAAFRSEFEELESKKFGFKYIGIVQFDVNNLKIINDSKGHEAGDLLIKTAADIINNSFGQIGNCYRTGGDEFVALISNDHAPIVCEEAIYKFNRLIDKFNAQEDKPFDLRIAYGIAYYQYDKTSNLSLKEIHKMADDRMYENKKMLKARYARTPEEAVIR